MKKIAMFAMAALLGLSVLTGCGAPANNGEAENDAQSQGGQSGGAQIAVVSREDGSGTRSAFVELMGIEQEDAEGNAVDMTTIDADITDSTSVMMTTVSGNVNAIGYVSLGSLDETLVKAVSVDGVAATAENVKNGTYAVSRPFNIATKGEPSEAAAAFISYIMSAEGQAVIEENGYISAAEGEPFAGTQVAGEVVVAGSTSVSPVMEKLKEAYEAINPNADIVIQTSDSSTGMNMTIEGGCDIGMASRAVKDSELEKGLTATVIAIDGIAVIVNQDSAVENLTSEQIRDIYTGAITNWADVQ